MTAPAVSVLADGAPMTVVAPIVVAGDRMFLAEATARPTRSVAAFLVSLALHALPLAGMAAMMTAQVAPAAFGHDAIEVDFIMAETAIDLPDVPQPDDPRFAPAPNEHVLEREVPDVQKTQDKQKVAPDDERDESVFAKLPEPEQPSPPHLTNLVPVQAPAVVQEEARAALSDAHRARIARHLVRFKRFPGHAQARGGRVLVAFELSPDGRVLETTLLQSSGVSAFDTEAVAMIRRAEPFPVEARTRSGTFTFVVPVSFRLRG